MYWINQIWPFSRLTSNIIFYGSRKKKKIALTFDDGPSNYTIKIAKLLEKYKGKGTFYIMGNRISKYKKELKYLHKNKHEVGNHSYNHPAMAFLSKVEIYKQINKTDELLFDQRIAAKTIRPPHGSFGFNLYRISRELNKKLILWDVDPEDWDSKTSQKEVVNNILKKVKHGSIIDLHEYEYDTKKGDKIISILEEILPILKDKGYKFVTISELIK